MSAIVSMGADWDISQLASRDFSHKRIFGRRYTLPRMGMRERIEQRLNELGLSRTKASRMAGKSPTFLRDFLDSPSASMTIANAELLAPILGVTPAWLAFGDEGPPDEDADIVKLLGRAPKETRSAIRTILKASKAE